MPSKKIQDFPVPQTVGKLYQHFTTDQGWGGWECMGTMSSVLCLVQVDWFQVDQIKRQLYVKTLDEGQ